MMIIIPPLLTDGYKLDHRRQYPEETTLVYSNMTPRKSRVEGINKIVAFGPQYYCISALINDWNNNFFKVKFQDVADEFYETMEAYLGKDAADAIGTQHWKELHDLGYLPLEVKALPEGTKCPIGMPIFTVVNTDKRFFWLTNYIETDMSAEIWGMCTSATTSDAFFKIFERYALETVGDASFVPYQGHDFSYRGMFGRHAAIISGASHLTSGFVGSDCVPSIPFMRKYYKADIKKDVIAQSVAATEHAVMCAGTGFYIRKNNLSWERYGDAEFEVFKRLITEVYPNGIVSLVGDTWNIWKVITEYLPKLKKEILARNGKVVIRPDSGDPVEILCGLKTWEGYRGEEAGKLFTVKDGSKKEVSQVEAKGVVEALWDIFGGTTTAKGYKLLDSHIGTIYGDSINLYRADKICSKLKDKGFASTNWVAGIGSFTYQGAVTDSAIVTRDTYGFAMKATYIEVDIDGKIEGIEVFKDPITDDGTKKSAKGLISVSYDTFDKKYTFKDQVSWEEEAKSSLQTIYKNGKMIKEYSLNEIRSLVRSN